MVGRHSLVVVALLLEAGCSSTQPLDPADVPLDVQVTLTDTVYTYACAGWGPRVPNVERTLMDVRFLQAEPGGTAAPANAASIIRNAGGRIIYEFNVSTIRAELHRDSVPALMGRGNRIEFVQTVTRPDDYTVFINVTLTRNVTEADLQAVKAIGATDAYVLPPPNMYRATIDDRTIPSVKRLPDVRYLYWGWGIGCIR